MDRCCPDREVRPVKRGGLAGGPAAGEAVARPARWSATFGRLDPEKRERVLGCAKRAFAEHGYAGANINLIAEDARISVGSLYKYFSTKQDLFLALIEGFHDQITAAIRGVLDAEPGFRGRVAALMKLAIESSTADPESVRIYIACTTEELAPMAALLTRDIEEASAVPYRRMIEEGQRSGEVDPSLDPGWAAFFLDNVLMLLQYSFASAYYRERFALYTGVRPDAERAEAELLRFMERALAPR